MSPEELLALLRTIAQLMLSAQDAEARAARAEARVAELEAIPEEGDS